MLFLIVNRHKLYSDWLPTQNARILAREDLDCVSKNQYVEQALSTIFISTIDYSLYIRVQFYRSAANSTAFKITSFPVLVQNLADNMVQQLNIF